MLGSCVGRKRKICHVRNDFLRVLVRKTILLIVKNGSRPHRSELGTRAIRYGELGEIRTYSLFWQCFPCHHSCSPDQGHARIFSKVVYASVFRGEKTLSLGWRKTQSSGSHYFCRQRQGRRILQRISDGSCFCLRYYLHRVPPPVQQHVEVKRPATAVFEQLQRQDRKS